MSTEIEYDGEPDFFYDESDQSDASDQDSESNEIDYPDFDPDSEQEEEEQNNMGEYEPFPPLLQPPSDLDSDSETKPLFDYQIQPKTCCLCQETGLGITTQGQVATLDWIAIHDFSILCDRNLERLQDQWIVTGPCQKPDHLYCVKCLRKVFLCDATLARQRGRVPCMYPFQSQSQSSQSRPCHDFSGQPLSFSEFGIACLLTPVELVHVQAQIHRVSAAGTHGCNHAVPVTDCLNHFVWTQKHAECRNFPRLYSQSNLQFSEVCRQIQHIWQADIPDVHCNECDVFLRKTSDCNALSHCGIEICHVCGRNDIRLHPNHWQTCSREDPAGLTTEQWNQQRKQTQLQQLFTSLPREMQQRLSQEPWFKPIHCFLHENFCIHNKQ